MPPSVSDVTVSPAEKETRLSFSPCPQRKQHGDVTSYRRKVRKKVWSGAKKSIKYGDVGAAVMGTAAGRLFSG
jgi:hypothetical protein